MFEGQQEYRKLLEQGLVIVARKRRARLGVGRRGIRSGFSRTNSPHRALSWVAGCDLTNGSGRSRVTATVFWAPLLLAFPVGTKLAFWPLYMVHSERGHFVTSEEYHQVCAETPEMKRLSFIGLIIGVPLGLGLLFFLFSQFVSHFL